MNQVHKKRLHRKNYRHLKADAGKASPVAKSVRRHAKRHAHKKLTAAPAQTEAQKIPQPVVNETEAVKPNPVAEAAVAAPVAALAAAQNAETPAPEIAAPQPDAEAKPALSVEERANKLAAEEDGLQNYKDNTKERLWDAGKAVAEVLPPNPIGVGVQVAKGGYNTLKSLGSGDLGGAAGAACKGVVETGLALVPGFIRPVVRNGARSLLRGIGLNACAPDATDIPRVVDNELFKEGRLAEERQVLESEKGQGTELAQNAAAPETSVAEKQFVDTAPRVINPGMSFSI